MATVYARGVPDAGAAGDRRPTDDGSDGGCAGGGGTCTLAPRRGLGLLTASLAPRSMILEHRTVSRKTPNDGMLEISPPTAQHLEADRQELAIVVNGSPGTGRITEMACGCAKGEGRHVHQFLASELLRSLTPDARVLLELDEDARVVRVTEQR